MILSPFIVALTQSGTIRSLAKSPPPITLPALAVEIGVDSASEKKDFLYEEGDYYTLPQVLGVTKWYSTSEGKYYKPLEKVKVNHSMHFIAK